MFRKKINSTYGIIKAAVSLLLVISLTGCSLSGGDKKAENTKAPASTVKQAEVKTLSKEDAFAKAAQYLKNMSVVQKVGQLFVVNLEQLDSSKGSYYEWKKCSKKMKEAIKKNSIGGVIMFSRNIGKRKQTKKLIREIQKAADIPAFVTVDEEGGEVARIAGNPDMKTTKYPSMEDVGKKKDADYVNNMGKTIGNDIKKLGFNVDFAPVADVLTNVDNTVIGNRAFSSDAGVAAQMVSSAVTGLQETGVSACLKHFPGHGDTAGDSHTGGAQTDRTKEEMEAEEFLPFQSGIEAGVDMIMVGHITAPNLTDGDSLPASISEKIITGVLRNELGYHGIIITDAMNMGAITEYYKSDVAAIMALKAGADMVLMPENFEEAYQGVLDAVADGTVSEERINDSLRRIYRVKLKSRVL